MADGLVSENHLQFQINGWAVKISIGALINVVVTFVMVGVAWGVMNTKMDDALSRVKMLEEHREDDNKQLMLLRQELYVATQKLTDFQRDYERDANRYIRDLNDPNRKR